MSWADREWSPESLMDEKAMRKWWTSDPGRIQSWPETPVRDDRPLLRALRLVAALLLLILPGTTNDIGHITAAGMVFVGLCCLREL